MKSLVWTAPETMEIQELERPSIQADEVLIEVKAVGICGSEIEGYLGHNSLRVPPLVMGHEFAGVVVECGAEATGIQIGQKVTVNPLIACGSCARCRQGLVNLCAANRSIVGIHRPGAFADYVAVPAANVHVVPADSDLFQLSLTEPLACSLRAARRAMDMHPFANVVVIGAGAIGLLSAMVCRLLGASTVTVLDTNDERLQTALQVCADHALNPTRDDLAAQVPVKDGDTGVDVVIDAAGFQPTRSSAIELLRRRNVNEYRSRD